MYCKSPKFSVLQVCVITIGILTSILLSSCTDLNQANTAHKNKIIGCVLDDVDINYLDYGKSYSFLYDLGTRERYWEEDILNFANVFLNPYSGHPHITNRNVTVGRLPLSVDAETKITNVFNESAKLNFIKGINYIIKAIPVSTDKELLFMCHELITRLNDSHTYLYPLPRYIDTDVMIYPFQFEYMCDNKNECGYYCVYTDQKHGAVLKSKLVSINNLPMDIVYEKLSRICVNDSGEYMQGILINDFLYYDELIYLGIVTSPKTTFTFETSTGKHIKIDVNPIDLYEAYDKKIVLSKYDKGAFWFEANEQNKLIYARIVQCLPSDKISINGEELYISQSQFWELLARECEKHSDYKLVIDFRGNSGGNLSLTISELGKIDRTGVNVFVIVDEHVASAASIMTLGFKNFTKNCTIIGSKTQQGGCFGYSSFNPGVKFHYFPSVHVQISSSLSAIHKEKHMHTITPDHVLYQRIEDYLLGKNTFLDYVLNYTCPRR